MRAAVTGWQGTLYYQQRIEGSPAVRNQEAVRRGWVYRGNWSDRFSGSLSTLVTHCRMCLSLLLDYMPPDTVDRERAGQ